ncbi:hypothetical protein Thiowin_03858 [Thiorhodovibrio winogradskyi]|uniref:DUF4258 domain-containing protein n=1 Tax=Thiorhodovibrio winogradskyi TaxID=77007 RepID=A0ABZ0SCY3_9GAMM|nr:DUF4258 domain-containing protein [Thiorhodovibrio winogradskyi]
MIAEIQDKIRSRHYELSRHALDQSIKRGIRIAELEEALLGKAEIIEDYPDDKYGPSCLILGYSVAGRALHIVCSYPSRPLVKIITVYEPDATKWLADRHRMYA